jgi:hypothetical protein
MTEKYEGIRSCEWQGRILPIPGRHAKSRSQLVSTFHGLNRPHEGMRFSVEYILVQAGQSRLAKDQLQILQRLGCPEALHTVRLGRNRRS